MKIQIEKYMKFKNSKLNTYKVSGAGRKLVEVSGVRNSLSPG